MQLPVEFRIFDLTMYGHWAPDESVPIVRCRWYIGPRIVSLCRFSILMFPSRTCLYMRRLKKKSIFCCSFWS